MKLVCFLLIVVLTACSFQKKSISSNQPTSRYRSSRLTTQTNNDTLKESDFQKVPLLGRSEGGILPEIEGTWQLVSIEGKTVEHGFDSVVYRKAVKGFNSDTTTTTTTSNGVTTTETIIERPAQTLKKITPLQGSTYHIPEKPYISFYGSNETFSGFTGCNRMAGRYKLVGAKNIIFDRAAASTRMACIGDYNEDNFISALKEVNSFAVDKGQLQFLKGGRVVLVFERKS